MRFKQKVFCIGMTKTGTTSLMEALKLLGLKVSNFYTIENYKKYDVFIGDQLCYIPVDTLRKRYPNDLFIFTHRKDSETWFSSIYSFSRQDNKINNLVVRQIRHRIYGYDMPTEENKQDFINRYEKRELNADKSFQNSNKILKMCLDNGHGWNELCDFLDLDIPKVDFPHANKTKQNKTDGTN